MAATCAWRGSRSAGAAPCARTATTNPRRRRPQRARENAVCIPVRTVIGSAPMSAKSPPSLYDVLGLDPGASAQDVRQAWRRLAQQNHPDRGEGADSEAMVLINQAYEVLSDPDRRARYDH